jgi:DNA uptake protein ComE-like DNA-binding protein
MPQGPSSLERRRAERVVLSMLAVILAAYVLLRVHQTSPLVASATPLPPLRIDPNTAPWEDLAALPGLGERTARRIVAYRQTRQTRGESVLFHRPEDLDPIEGIGPRLIEELSPHLRFPSTEP